MKLLLVEDQPDKRQAIKEFLITEMLKPALVDDASSLRGGLGKVVNGGQYDLILLDMSMPNFDAKSDDFSDGSAENYAGSEFLEQLSLRMIHIPVIVITQYSSFDGGAVTLASLDQEFRGRYADFYKGYVYFNSTADTWKNNLVKIISEIN